MMTRDQALSLMRQGKICVHQNTRFSIEDDRLYFWSGNKWWVGVDIQLARSTYDTGWELLTEKVKIKKTYWINLYDPGETGLCTGDMEWLFSDEKSAIKNAAHNSKGFVYKGTFPITIEEEIELPIEATSLQVQKEKDVLIIGQHGEKAYQGKATCMVCEQPTCRCYSKLVG